MDKNHRETEKLYEKKFKDIQNTIEHNQKKLKIMQQVYNPSLNSNIIYFKRYFISFVFIKC